MAVILILSTLPVRAVQKIIRLSAQIKSQKWLNLAFFLLLSCLRHQAYRRFCGNNFEQSYCSWHLSFSICSIVQSCRLLLRTKLKIWGKKTHSLISDLLEFLEYILRGKESGRRWLKRITCTRGVEW